MQKCLRTRPRTKKLDTKPLLKSLLTLAWPLLKVILDVFYVHCKYMQWNYSEDTSKNCKTELQFFYCNMDKYFAIHSTMQKCRFKFTVITLHLEQQSNVKNTVKNCKLDYSYSTVLCTFLSCVPYLQCTFLKVNFKQP